MLLLQPPESDEIPGFHRKAVYIEGVPFDLMAWKCAIRRKTTVRPNYVFLLMTLHTSVISRIFIGKAVLAYLYTLLSLTIQPAHPVTLFTPPLSSPPLFTNNTALSKTQALGLQKSLYIHVMTVFLLICREKTATSTLTSKGLRRQSTIS